MSDSGKRRKYKRVHITLPEDTIQYIKNVTKKPRSTFINDAVLFYGKLLKKVAEKKKMRDS